MSAHPVESESSELPMRGRVRSRETMPSVSERVLPSREAERLRSTTFTYSEVGSTRADTMPSGYANLRRSLEIGAGTERFEQAGQVLLGWDMHRRAGLRVRTSNEHVVREAVAVLRLGVGSLGVDAPVRVVYLVDEPRRKGFAYGTLQGHPESGEEAFVLELHEDGAVTFTITAFSRPSTLLARVGGPITRAFQSWVTNRYLRAV
jgi:uncharacterized protein (UPF0548 family)